MPVRTCDHLKEDGVYCGSPALHGRNYCSFHLNLRGRRLQTARARRRGHNPALNLPFPEDMHAVQVCLAEIMWALAEDRIDTKRAWAILNSLQQASSNLIRTPGWQGQREAVPATRPLRALTDPHFEQRYGLPPGTDLNAEPEPAFSDVSRPAEAAAVAAVVQSPAFPQPATPAKDSASPQLETRNLKPETPSELMGGPQLPEVGNCGNDKPNPPARVPVPEDQLRELNMTHWEKLEFFIYKLRFYRISDEQEQRLKVAWLRDKRRRTHDEYLAAQRDGSEDASIPMDGPDYTDTKLMPFGFGNMLEDAADDEEEEDAA